MTLTILATNPTPDLFGASRMALESVRGFRAEEWHVTVTIPAAGELVDGVTAAGAAFVTCPSPVLRKGFASPLGLLRLVWETLRSIPPSVRLLRAVRPDLLYVNTITQPLWLVLGRCLRIPVLCHVHEGESGASPLVRRLLALPLLLTTRLVVNSRFSTSVLTASIPRLAFRCEVVRNGVAGPANVTPPRAELDPPIRLLYVGRLSERKGVRDAVDAVAELDQRGVRCELDIVGSVFPGYEWVDDDLRSRARAAGTADRVRFHGFDPDVWPHLARADILVVPSRVEEPFGNTAVEGALAARPVVATRIGGLIEATDGMRAAALVAPADPVALAAAVADLAERWAEVRAHAIADVARAAARYSPLAYQAAVRQVAGTMLGKT